ncbi:LuxR C-terminal-related transcriptional regulator [Thalassobaculum sp. OXR-137]|uniref:helix-turn-helix transcriptional regulator n=1 Tax=Thalassobaculum sp. OXR-137 TaxID=3100173 RepID=UPI002AC9BB4E|nr:LuxR C-terminal-related transcriptional regulator [Thalassobaculum sp. OXR-137]WPZ37026.1 LuxR C-terminal-related transcriptional regulator [Thalassobaculum sp. OXR-137]
MVGDQGATGERGPKPAWVSAGSLLLAACMAFFAGDVIWDVAEHLRDGVGYGAEESVHLLFETLAVLGLGYGAWLLRGYVALLRRQSAASAQTIASLRGSFELVLVQKFDDWKLTAAERDVTLLIIKGLSVAEIAQARQTAPGTVKAQSSSIFRKIGVSSRTDLMSHVLEEFIDASSLQA